MRQHCTVSVGLRWAIGSCRIFPHHPQVVATPLRPWPSSIHRGKDGEMCMVKENAQTFHEVFVFFPVLPCPLSFSISSSARPLHLPAHSRSCDERGSLTIVEQTLSVQAAARLPTPIRRSPSCFPFPTPHLSSRSPQNNLAPVPAVLSSPSMSYPYMPPSQTPITIPV